MQVFGLPRHIIRGAAKAVGVSRSTLYRWSRRCEFKSGRAA